MQHEFHIRRELTLESQAVSTSDDPLEAYLECRGWPLERIRALRYSIVTKLQPRLFESDEELSSVEVQLQEHIQEWLDGQTRRKS